MSSRFRRRFLVLLAETPIFKKILHKGDQSLFARLTNKSFAGDTDGQGRYQLIEQTDVPVHQGGGDIQIKELIEIRVAEGETAQVPYIPGRYPGGRNPARKLSATGAFIRKL